MQFQLLLSQDAEQQDFITSPLSSTLSSGSSSSSKLFHAIPSPFKRLNFPQHLHLPHFHSESKTQFVIVNETLPKPSPPFPPLPALAPRSLTPMVPTAPISRPRSISPPRERTRRYSLDEVLPDYAGTTSRLKDTLDFIKGTNGQEALDQEPGAELQEPIPILAFDHVSPWSNSTDLPQSTLAPDTHDSFTTPFSPAIVTDPPSGQFRFEKSKVEPRTADLVSEVSEGWMPQREGLRKHSARDVPIRNIKISAPAPLDTATNLVDFQIASPRTAPLPPSSDSSPSAILKNSDAPLTGSAITSEERPTNGSNSAGISQTDANRVTNEPVRKVPGFPAVAKVARRLLRNQSQTPQTLSPIVKRTSLSPLLYSASTPIERHILAISTRIKDEFKMKLRNEIELPVVDAATEEELIQQVQDMNEHVRQCTKELARLLHRSSTDKKGSKSTKAKKVLDIQSEVRTKLNSFLVTRVLQPFSIQLNEKDDKAVRDRYEEIAPSGEFAFDAIGTRILTYFLTSTPIRCIAMARRRQRLHFPPNPGTRSCVGKPRGRCLHINTTKSLAKRRACRGNKGAFGPAHPPCLPLSAL
jgi:hypothetical protein